MSAPRCRDGHVYGSGRECLRCGYRAPRPERPREYRTEQDIENILRARPVVDDVAGWDPEEGDPWT